MRELVIPIPVHPNDADLPLSLIRLRLPSGGMVALCIPMQGEKTFQNVIDTLAIWKPTLVVQKDYEI